MRFAVALACAALLSGAPLAGQGDSLVVRESAAPRTRARQRPEPDARTKACLTPGTHVAALGVAPFWRKVRLPDGRTGWPPKRALEPVGAAAVPTPGVDHWLEEHVVDVGQGDAIWIHTPDDGVPGSGIYEGRNIIIDGGPDASDGRN